jgi:hypothetical protein
MAVSISLANKAHRLRARKQEPREKDTPGKTTIRHFFKLIMAYSTGHEVDALSRSITGELSLPAGTPTARAYA